MNRELRDKWVAALRSGEYKQGRAFLHMNNEYCCLGVLCVVAGLPEETINERGTLSAPGVDQLNLLSDNPHIDIERHVDAYYAADDLETRLVSMNDNGRTFAEIADWIEAEAPVEA